MSRTTGTVELDGHLGRIIRSMIYFNISLEQILTFISLVTIQTGGFTALAAITDVIVFLSVPVSVFGQLHKLMYLMKARTVAFNNVSLTQRGYTPAGNARVVNIYFIF
jgi:hypothetical protein